MPIWKKILPISFLPILIGGCSHPDIKPRTTAEMYRNGKFESKMDEQAMGLGESLKIMWQLFMTNTPDLEPVEGDIPVKTLTRTDLATMANNSVVRLAHSSLLFKLNERYVLTDPVFSERTSPVSFAGPKRFHHLPMALEDLPFIDVVILSHNHYDHFDIPTLAALKEQIGHIYTTLGLKSALLALGFNDSQVTELDWWESIQSESLEITATPAQHFSGRGLFDRNQTLWASWVIKTPEVSLFFGADSGYFDGFKQIGEWLGPFDMTFLEDGAYNERWSLIHMMPEEAVQAHIDLRGNRLFPIHNGSFKLSTHPWKEPFERLDQAAQARGIATVFPKFGEVIPVKNPEVQAVHWWK